MLTRTTRFCPTTRRWWCDGEDPKCSDDSHTHIAGEMHIHRTPIRMANGIEVIGASFDLVEPYGREAAPGYGIYLDERWSPPWSHEHVAWPDFGLPSEPGELLTSLRGALARARDGEAVEIGCLGGHGRTGTALACLAVMCGTPAGEAVRWVREVYCTKAVETDAQVAFVASFAELAELAD